MQNNPAGVFLLVLLVIGGFWLVGSAKDLAGSAPESVEVLWAKRGAELVPGCADARVAGEPLAGDVTGDGAFEYFVTLHCGGSGAVPTTCSSSTTGIRVAPSISAR